MCGICGVLSSSGVRPAHLAQVRQTADALAHRGPDAEGFWHGRAAALGHRRLSITDLRPEGNQPMLSEDASVAVAVNGEIYNFRDLRRELEARGHRFRSRSDSEVLVHLYEDRGIDCLQDLRGMFAFALCVVFAMNRYDKRIGITPERVSEILKHEISVAIPLDEKVVITAVNRGVPFMLDNKAQPVGRGIFSLAEAVRARLTALETEDEASVKR